MKSEDLQRLTTFCEDFRRFRDNTVDGQGNNLHDIKNTFDYVEKTIDSYKLAGTKFGSELADRVRKNTAVLSQICLCLQNLEKSLNTFIDSQTKENNQIGDAFSSEIVEKTTSIKTSSYSAYEAATKAAEAGLDAQVAAQRVQEAMKNFDVSAIERLKEMNFTGLQKL